MKKLVSFLLCFTLTIFSTAGAFAIDQSNETELMKEKTRATIQNGEIVTSIDVYATTMLSEYNCPPKSASSTDEYITVKAYSTIYYSREYSSFHQAYGYRLVAAEGGFTPLDSEVGVVNYTYEALNRDVVDNKLPSGFSSGTISCGQTWSYTCPSDYITSPYGWGECGVISAATCKLLDGSNESWNIYCHNFVPADL